MALSSNYLVRKLHEAIIAIALIAFAVTFRYQLIDDI